MESLQGLINTMIGAVLVLLGWIGKTLHAMVRDTGRKVSELRDDHNILALKIAERYVTREDSERRFVSIEGKLDKILEKLDSKVDKVPHWGEP